MKNLSKCHQAPVTVIHGEEGTNYFTCSQCNEPCDIGAAGEGAGAMTHINIKALEGDKSV